MDYLSHTTSFNQYECFVYAKYSHAMLKFSYDIDYPVWPYGTSVKCPNPVF